MNKVISFGEALVDMLSNKLGNASSEQHETFTKFPGGAPANVAAAVGKLGGNSYFAGKIGHDMFGDFMRQSLEQANVNTDYLLQTKQAKTALAFVSLDETGERSFEFYRNPSADMLFEAEEFLPAWFSEAGIFHFCSNTLTEENINKATLHGIKTAKNTGFIVSFDINLRLNLWPEGKDPYGTIWHCIEQSDLIKLCTEELEFLCRGRSEDVVIQQIIKSGPSLVLVTDGSADLHYHTKSGSGKIAPPKATMIDSTAAGDAFVGGFLFALANKDISQGNMPQLVNDVDSLERMLDFACSCGAYAVTKQGAFSSLPTLSDLNISLP